MSQGIVKTSLELVPTPSNVLPQDEDEVFVRLEFHDPDSTDLDNPVLGFTMPVGALLRMLYEIADDVKKVVEDDMRRGMATLPAPETINLN